MMLPTSYFPPKRHIVTKRDPSREETTQSIMSDVDKASSSSIPNVLPDVGRSIHYNEAAESSINLARSFMKRGELNSAEVALLRSRHVSEILQIGVVCARFRPILFKSAHNAVSTVSEINQVKRRIQYLYSQSHHRCIQQPSRSGA